MLLKNILAQAVNEGLKFYCYYDDPSDCDYIGFNRFEALEALTACDEMQLSIRDEHGKKLAWLLILNEVDQDPEEQIADYAITDWMREHWGAEIDF